MKITRREVLAAIRYENLAPGSFMEGSDTNAEICTVCAVGAIFRRRGLSIDAVIEEAAELTVLGPLYPYEYEPYEETAEREADYGRYLNGLSVMFEGLAAKYGKGKRTRERLAKFVKKNFPTSFEA